MCYLLPVDGVDVFLFHFTKTQNMRRRKISKKKSIPANPSRQGMRTSLETSGRSKSKAPRYPPESPRRPPFRGLLQYNEIPSELRRQGFPAVMEGLGGGGGVSPGSVPIW